jgi:hypothetical protein
MPTLVRPALPAKLDLPEIHRAFRGVQDNLARVNDRLRPWAYDLVHGVELEVESPVPYIVTGAVAVASVNADTGDAELPVQALTVRQISPGVLGITAQFAPPTGVCSAYRDAAHSLANGANTVVPLDAAGFESGALEFDSVNTGILCAQPGYVQINAELEFSASAAGTARRMFVAKLGGSSTEVWAREAGAPSAVVTAFSGSGLIEVEVDDVIQLAGFQDSGGALALTVTQRRCKLDARYVAPPANYEARVSLIFLD